jgi:hypothetical protein
MQLDTERELEIIAAFVARLISAIESRSTREEPLSVLEQMARDAGIDFDNPPYADGSHLKKSK